LNDMDGIPRDTTREAFLRQIEILRGLGISGRAAMTFELSDNLRQIVRDGVRYRHPEWNETQTEQEVRRIVLGDRLFREAFGECRPPNGRPARPGHPALRCN
jgi:hypothetical protein